jgi:hypothetical protein
MPLVRMTRRRGRPADENRRLHAPSFEITADRSAAFTLVEITAFPGRSVAAKRALFQSMARRFEAAGVSPSDLFVVLTEPPLENWSPRNGVSSFDDKPGFKLDV